MIRVDKQCGLQHGKLHEYGMNILLHKTKMPTPCPLKHHTDKVYIYI